MAQSQQIADALRELGAEVELVRVQTFGDVTSAPLSSLGSVGVFVAAVREAVLDGRCDLAVHSLKDLPTTPAEGLTLGAVPRREDPRDALCARDGLTLATLPSGATVGTGSPRRAAQLAVVRPDLTIVDLRGNVDTRLGRVGADLDAVVLAVAGLNRLGRADAITDVLAPDVLVPAPAQGALGLECRADDAAVRALLAQLDDTASRTAVTAEREVMRLVEAGCAAPFGALADVTDSTLTITARLLATQVRTQTLSGPVAEASAIATRLADEVAPLRGMRVLMPSSAMADALAAEGVRVTTAPLTETQPLAADGLAAVLAGRPDVVAFTSARTFDVLAGAGVRIAELVRPETAVAAVGAATAAAAEASGLRVMLRPREGSGGAALAAVFPDGPGTVVIPGAAEPAPDLADALSGRGWAVVPVAVYRTTRAGTVEDDVRDAWPDGFDAFVATAPSNLAAARELLGAPTPPLVAIGSTTAKAAERDGLPVAAVAAEASAAGVAAALTTLRKKEER